MNSNEFLKKYGGYGAGYSPAYTVRDSDLTTYGRSVYLSGVDWAKPTIEVCECKKPKPTENDKTAKVLSEIEDAQDDAADLLKAADFVRGKRISLVEYGDNTLNITFERIDADDDKDAAKEVQDVQTHTAMNQVRANVVHGLSGVLQHAGRSMLTLIAIASSKLVQTELQQMQVEFQQANVAKMAQDFENSVTKFDPNAKQAHGSDCAKHDEPAMPANDCDCEEPTKNG